MNFVSTGLKSNLFIYLFLYENPNPGPQKNTDLKSISLTGADCPHVRISLKYISLSNYWEKHQSKQAV